MARIKTKNINRAAFFSGLGAKFISVSGKPPHSKFVLEVPKWVLIYEKYISIISYQRYLNQRSRLKRIARKAAGLPVRYTSPKKHSLNDVLGFNLKKAYNKSFGIKK